MNERREVEHRKSIKRASWRIQPTSQNDFSSSSSSSSSSADGNHRTSSATSGPTDLMRVFEDLSRAELAILTLYELGILPEGLTMDYLQSVSQDPHLLHRFVELLSTPSETLHQETTYREFLKDYVLPHHHHPNPLHLPLSKENYPREGIVAILLELQKAGVLSAEEYVVLHRRCQEASPVLRRIYNNYLHDIQKEKNDNNLLQDRIIENIGNSFKTACTLFLHLQPEPKGMTSTHTILLQTLETTSQITAEEARWVTAEYTRGNAVIRNAFALCEETGDMNGLRAMLSSVMQLVRKYELAVNAQKYFVVLVKELQTEGSITERQAATLDVLLCEPAPCLVGLYSEYQRSGDFEGLLSALLYVSSCDWELSSLTSQEGMLEIHSPISRKGVGSQSISLQTTPFVSNLSKVAEDIGGEGEQVVEGEHIGLLSQISSSSSSLSSSSSSVRVHSQRKRRQVQHEKKEEEEEEEEYENDEEEEVDDDDDDDDDGTNYRIPDRGEVEAVIRSLEGLLTMEEETMCLGLTNESNIDVIYGVGKVN